MHFPNLEEKFTLKNMLHWNGAAFNPLAKIRTQKVRKHAARIRFTHYLWHISQVDCRNTTRRGNNNTVHRCLYITERRTAVGRERGKLRTYRRKLKEAIFNNPSLKGRQKHTKLSIGICSIPNQWSELCELHFAAETRHVLSEPTSS